MVTRLVLDMPPEFGRPPIELGAVGASAKIRAGVGHAAPRSLPASCFLTAARRYHEHMEMKIPWISKIETRDDALTVLKQGTVAFFFLGALHIVPFLVLKSYVALLETTVVVVAAFAMLKLHSRGAAAVLLTLSCAEALVALANIFGARFGAGSSVVLAGLMIWVAVRTAQATSALERMPDEDEDAEAALDR